MGFDTFAFSSPTEGALIPATADQITGFITDFDPTEDKISMSISGIYQMNATNIAKEASASTNWTSLENKAQSALNISKKFFVGSISLGNEHTGTYLFGDADGFGITNVVRLGDASLINNLKANNNWIA